MREDEAKKRTCRTCHFYAPGNSWPDYEGRGTCGLINASGDPAKRPVRIRPVGEAWLEVINSFVCGEHLPEGEPS